MFEGSDHVEGQMPKTMCEKCMVSQFKNLPKIQKGQETLVRL